ncbi:AAA family ATPase [Brevundimonas sp. TWP2-3-2]|uniref:AAA family ATPase n=1 Tax=unclassified Brevundimonas TaxID=2622653 RepID=UPI003CE95CE2
MVRFSNRGYADELEAEAADTKRLLGCFVMDGQATMIYAAPNTGKTLIILYLLLKAIEEGLIDANNVFYFNGDDGSQGLSAKNRLMQDAGAHMLAPGRRGMKTKHLVETMIQAVTEGAARGTLIIIDTLKKCTDPMSKKDNSEFAQVCREYVMAGGTIVALGHTRKNPKANGAPQYQGTTDILEDFDAVYIAELVATKDDAKQRVVRFKMEKKRADSPDVVGYAYGDELGMSYEEKLASVTPVPPEELEDYRADAEDYSHIDVMETISRLIEAGEGEGKMALAKKAAKACGVSQRAAISVLEDHTGTTDITHLWIARTGPRGVQVYEMVPRP